MDTLPLHSWRHYASINQLLGISSGKSAVMLMSCLLADFLWAYCWLLWGQDTLYYLCIIITYRNITGDLTGLYTKPRRGIYLNFDFSQPLSHVFQLLAINKWNSLNRYECKDSFQLGTVLSEQASSPVGMMEEIYVLLNSSTVLCLGIFI